MEIQNMAIFDEFCKGEDWTFDQEIHFLSISQKLSVLEKNVIEEQL